MQHFPCSQMMQLLGRCCLCFQVDFYQDWIPPVGESASWWRDSSTSQIVLACVTAAKWNISPSASVNSSTKLVKHSC